MQLDRDQLRFLARLARTADGETLLKILRDRRSEADKAARTHRGEDVHRHLGAADELDKLVALIETAPANLTRLEASTQASNRRAVVG